jgi:hypothetical protein
MKANPYNLRDETRHECPGFVLAPLSVRWLIRLFLIAWAASGVQAQVSREYQIKAAFVYNFTKFVEWPATCFSEATDPIRIGVFAKSPYTKELENAVKDRKVNVRPLLVIEIRSVEEARGMHLVVLDSAANGQMKEMLAALKNAPVLTIGESEQFADADGILTFVREGDKVRFEANLDAAQQAGLKISAQFLKLAKTVRKRNQGKP